MISLWALSFAKRSFDQRRCCRKIPPQTTSQKTLQGYKNLYSGEDFDIHYHYSQMLVQTWVTFLFAPGIPVLFPIALFGMIVLYLTNRFCLAYWHRRPPVYDEALNSTVIKMLGFAPILYALNGMWVYSN